MTVNPPALPSPADGNSPSVEARGTYLLTVAWIDYTNGYAVELGSVAHETRTARTKCWSAAPGATDKTPFYLEIRNHGQPLEQAKAISAETVEAILGEPLPALLARDRRNTLSIAPLKSKLKDKT